MSTVDPYFDGEKWWYSKASWRHAQQTRERAARKHRKAKVAKEFERLRRLGVDEEWIQRVARSEEGLRQ